MSFEDERVAIEGRFAANYTSTPVGYENVGFTPPKNAAYVELFILSGGGERMDIGTGASSRMTRHSGIIQVNIYTPGKTGTKTPRDYADVISAIFDGASFSAGNSGSIVCGVPDYRSMGVEDGKHKAVWSVAFRRTKFT